MIKRALFNYLLHNSMMMANACRGKGDHGFT
jgi:hypothetical protein